MVVGLGETADDILKIDGADLLLLGGEAHDRVLKEPEMAASAIVALRGGDLNKLLRHIYHVYTEVVALPDIADQVAAPRHYHATACLQTEGPLPIVESAESVMAVGMAKIARHLRVGYPP
jgi:hypothetical protein